MQLSEKVLEGNAVFFSKFLQQYEAVSRGLCLLTEKYPIALCAIYGSFLKGVRPGSDLDFLVLLKDCYREFGNIIEVGEGIKDSLEEFKVNGVPLDVQVRSVSSFCDITRGVQFKQSFCDDNIVIWEDGVSVDRRFIDAA